MQTEPERRAGSEPASAKAADDGDRAAQHRGAIGQVLMLGTNLAVGMAVFAALGYYVDRKRGGGVLWTVCGMFAGLAYGAYEVWKAVRLIEDTEKEQRRQGRPGTPQDGEPPDRRQQ